MSGSPSSIGEDVGGSRFSPNRVLVIDVGGSSVKVLATGQKESRSFRSGLTLTPKRMVSRVKKLVADWAYDVVSIGYPGPVLHGRPIAEPPNLGRGWVGFDFAQAFGCAVKVVNDPSADPGTTESKSRWDKETDVNLSLAASYRFAPGWSLGLEFLNEREFSRLVFWNGKYATNSGFFLGPTLHYGGENFFFTLTFLEQLPLADDYANPPPGLIVGNRTYADDFEKYRVRLKFGDYFWRG